MPIYEYACKKCKQEFELLVRGSETLECPECGSKRLGKMLSVPAAHMAGGGDLPVCEAAQAGDCGMPQCGSGGCMFGS